jgi:hypothetical protein
MPYKQHGCLGIYSEGGMVGAYNWTFTPPEDTIRVCADYRKDVTEIDETNNCESKTYTGIQSKIDAANPGDTIIICDGIYNGNIKVDKRLTIRSENGSANCIVQAGDPNDHVFEVMADYVNVSGFTGKDQREVIMREYTLMVCLTAIFPKTSVLTTRMAYTSPIIPPTTISRTTTAPQTIGMASAPMQIITESILTTS